MKPEGDLRIGPKYGLEDVLGEAEVRRGCKRYCTRGWMLYQRCRGVGEANAEVKARAVNQAAGRW
jgi:hypothetical protein